MATSLKTKKLSSRYSDDDYQISINEKEYIKLLESQFEEWEKTKRENQALKQLVQELSDKINSSPKSKRPVPQPLGFPIELIRKMFIPNIRPDIVRERIGDISTRIMVKKTEEWGLFKCPELVIRVPRTKDNKGKNETTVLYSEMGVEVFMALVKKQAQERLTKARSVSATEQKEIEELVPLEELQSLTK